MVALFENMLRCRVMGCFTVVAKAQATGGLAPLFRRAKQSIRQFIPSSLLLAGIVLGLTWAIRVVAPLAGIIVVAYLFSKKKWDALPEAIGYFGIAFLTVWLLWPFLWEAPVANLWAIATEMVDFPKDINVLFAGMNYRSIDLPASYLTVLIGIQLTLPVLLLSLGGILSAIKDYRSRRLRLPFLMLLIAAWFFVPVIAISLFRPTQYDNFRQFLFLLPPLFVLAGLALEALSEHLQTYLYGGLVILAILPGIIGIIQLHPYEYSYYNMFVGWANGANRRYETDYWATAYREAIEYVNGIAPLDAKVYLYGPDHTFRRFGRPDLVAQYEVYSPIGDLSVYDYTILSTRHAADELFPEGEVIRVIGRAGATFAVVKDLTKE
ncbi:MAG: hypothetical protein M1347_08035 [Chloroflexi bacterium]|nr:hypothetical protein [Chloroflexota bacterium]